MCINVRIYGYVRVVHNCEDILMCVLSTTLGISVNMRLRSKARIYVYMRIMQMSQSLHSAVYYADVPALRILGVQPELATTL